MARPRMTLADGLALTALCAILFSIARSAIYSADFTMIVGVSSSPDGRWLTALFDSGRIAVWDCASGEPTRVATSINGRADVGVLRPPLPVMFHLSANKVVLLHSSTKDRASIEYWDLATNRQLFAFPCDPTSELVSVTDDGCHLVFETNAGYQLITVSKEWDSIVKKQPFRLVDEQVGQEGNLEVRALSDGNVRITTCSVELPLISAIHVQFSTYEPTSASRVANWEMPDTLALLEMTHDGRKALLHSTEDPTDALSLLEFSTNGTPLVDSIRKLGPLDVDAYDALRISPDARTIAGFRRGRNDEQILDIVSLDDMRIVASQELPDFYSVFEFAGNDRIVMDNILGNSLTTWQLHQGGLTPLGLMHDRTWGQIIASCSALIALGTVWGIVLRRRPAVAAMTRPSSVPKIPPLLQSARLSILLRSTSAILVGGLAAFRLAGDQPLVTVLATFAIAAGVAYIVVRPLAGLIRLALRGLAAIAPIERRRIEQIVGHPVRESRWGALKMYFAGSSSIESIVTLERHTVQQLWRKWLRREPPTESNATLIGIEKQEHFRTYVGSDIPIPAVYASAYGHRLLVCEELCQQYLYTPAQSVRVLFTLWYAQLQRGDLLPPALQWMLNARLTSDDEFAATTLRALRRLRTVWNRQTPVAPLCIFELTSADFSLDTFNRFRQANFLQAAYWMDLATAWTAFLTGNRATDADRSFFAQIMSARRLPTNVQAYLSAGTGRSMDSLTTEWQQWLDTYEIPSGSDLPFNSQNARIASRALPALADREAPIPVQQAYVRSLGIVGGRESLLPLVEMWERLSTEPKVPRNGAERDQLLDDIHWSLMAITGEDYGGDVGTWRERIDLLGVPILTTDNTVPSECGTELATSANSQQGNQTPKELTGVATPNQRDVHLPLDDRRTLWDRWVSWGPKVQAWHIASTLSIVGGLWAVCYHVANAVQLSSKLAAMGNRAVPDLFWNDAIYLPRFLLIALATVGITFGIARVRYGLLPLMVAQALAATFCCDMVTASIAIAIVASLRRA